MVKSVTVRAPCSTANLGPGFDVFGMALDAFYDEVTVTKKPKSFGIKIVSSDDIPLDPKKNTAGIVAINMKKHWKISDGLEINIKKKVPAGYGMGSSAASAAACAIAINELSLKHPDSHLLTLAASGEKASAGTVHYDNVAASLYGGFVVVNGLKLGIIEKYRSDDYLVGKLLEAWRFGPPKWVSCVIAVPKIKVPKQKTKVSRGLLPKNVKFSDAIKNMASATCMVASMSNGADDSFLDYITDQIVEPSRKKMIPGFDKVKKNALKAGAAACTISGAGPSMIAFVSDGVNKKKVGEAMKKGFKSAKVDCDIVICKPSKGPIIKKRK
jgi:homoserine kinase